MTKAQEQNIQSLLVAAFPKYAKLWASQSFWGGPAEYRLCLEHENQPIAHLGFAECSIGLHNKVVVIAGIVAVCIHPKFQGRGVGKLMFAELKKILSQRHCDWFL